MTKSIPATEKIDFSKNRFRIEHPYRVKSYMQRLYRSSGLLVARVLPTTYTEPAPRVLYIVYVCYGIVPCSGFKNERLYHRPRWRAHVCMYVRSPAGHASSFSLFFSWRISMPTRDVGVRT